MTQRRSAVVVGGGIAGPVAAMALDRAGIDATVYEAHPRGADGVGVFLTLASNGIDALRTIDADPPALAAGFPTPSITLRSGSGKRLGDVRTGLLPADGTASHTLKRADLYEAIHDEAGARGIAVEHGKRLVDVEQTTNGVRALFEDGSEATGDFLIGADGVHSRVRTVIDPNAPAPTYEGLLSLGGYASGVQVDAEPGTYTLIFGRRRSSATSSPRTGRCGGSRTCRARTSPLAASSRRSQPRNGSERSPSCSRRTPDLPYDSFRPPTPARS